MAIQFDPEKTYPIETDDDVYTVDAFKVMVEQGHYNADNCQAYFCDGDKFMIEAPYFNIAQPPEWATHVVVWPK